jgi:hypothetical protein
VSRVRHQGAFGGGWLRDSIPSRTEKGSEGVKLGFAAADHFAGLRHQSRETVGGHVEPRPSGGGDLRPESVVSSKRRVIHRGRGAQICETCFVMEYCGRGDLRMFLNFHLELWCVALLLTSRYTPRLQPGCYACYYIQRNRSRVKNQVYLRATPTSSASLSSLVLRRVVVTASGYQARKR